MSEQKQTFAVSLAADADWQPGLRSFFEYRDLGIQQATGGAFKAHLMRFKTGSPETLRATGAHVHDLLGVAIVLIAIVGLVIGWRRLRQ